jgi:hypothetical protein
MSANRSCLKHFNDTAHAKDIRRYVSLANQVGMVRMINIVSVSRLCDVKNYSWLERMLVWVLCLLERFPNKIRFFFTIVCETSDERVMMMRSIVNQIQMSTKQHHLVD